MRVLAGGPARETESAVFRLHVEGLEVQANPSAIPNAPMLSADTTKDDIARMVGLDITIRHEHVPEDDDPGPRWHHEKIERVAAARQTFMEMGSACPCGSSKWHEHGYLRDVWADGRLCRSCESPRVADALFMVDTDVVLGPGVLERMWAVDADVVYGVFWTEADWGQPAGPIAPQVWRAHPYTFDEPTWEALNAPGVNEVEVYGGGACTLIRGRGFESSFFPLLESVRWNGGMWAGEDRTFCLGLETRGIRQVAVTGLPIVHVQPGMELSTVRREVGL